jgi:hypothetical protein
MNLDAYHAFIHTASHVGAWMLGIVISVMVVDLILMVIYTIRHGQSDGRSGTVETDDEPLSPPMWMKGRIGSWHGRTKRRIVASRSGFISNESLADGSATVGERLMVVGIITFLFCFFLVFLGMGLLMMEDNPLVLLMSAAVGVWLFNIFKGAHADYREAKKRVVARNSASEPLDRPPG